jgi:hypothetical protein
VPIPDRWVDTSVVALDLLISSRISTSLVGQRTPANDANWRTGVIEAAMTSSGPMGVGSTGFDRAVARGRQIESGWRITEFTAGSRARWDLVSGPYKGTGGYICEPVEGGTKFTLESDVRLSGFLAVLGPLVAIMGRRQNRTDVRRLRAILEADKGRGPLAQESTSG